MINNLSFENATATVLVPGLSPDLSGEQRYPGCNIITSCHDITTAVYCGVALQAFAGLAA
jgi:hypothetical protein